MCIRDSNYFFVALLVLLAIADGCFHLAHQGVIDLPLAQGLRVALDVILLVMVVIGGRVIPMFTNNGVPGAMAMRKSALERMAPGTVLLVLAADLLPAPDWAIAAVAVLAAATHAARLWLWQPWTTLRTPMVWILHAAYGWIVVAFVLRALAAAGWVADPLATHALTMGAIGSMTLGMMARTARGHTGRPLQADAFDLLMFVAIQVAVLLRVFGPLAQPAAYRGWIIAGGAMWSVAFALYAIRYGRLLVRPRPDGKPG